MSSPGSRPDISLAQVAGSALAAVSAAVVASFLGVGGTVLGAALGSTVATIAGAVYAHTLRQAGQRLGETRVLTVVTKAHAAHEQPGPGDVPVIGPSGATAEALEEGQEPPEDGTDAAAPERPRWMSAKALVALAVAAFLVAMVVISAVELTIGHSISGGSGTTVSRLVEHSSTQRSPTTGPTSTPTSPATTAPVPSPTVTGSPAPTGTPSQTPTGAPTTAPGSTPSTVAPATPG